ncbi:MAG: hypothetical protein ABIE74_02845 [Pseudomonadota bacterium]
MDNKGHSFSHEMPQVFRNLKQKILSSIPSWESGLNISRAKSFVRDQGLRVPDLLVISQTDLSRLNNIVGSIPSLICLLTGDVTGRYLPELQLSIVIRNPIMEEKNGTIYTESMIVHELFHGTSAFDYYFGFPVDRQVVDGAKFVWCPKIGFGGRWLSSGGIFEEGFAEYFRGKYVLEMSSPEERKLLSKNLALEEGLPLSTSLEMTFFSLDGTPFDTTCPIKYLYLTEENERKGVIQLPAALIFEAITKKNELFEDVLIKARSDLTYLRQLPKLFNSIGSGLYIKLRNIPDGEAGYTTGLIKTIEACNALK